MRLIPTTLFLMTSLIFSEEPETIDIIYTQPIFNSSHRMHSQEEVEKINKEYQQKQRDLHDHIVFREFKIPVSDYLSFTVPDTKVVWPSFISLEEKTFWRDTLQKFGNYQFPQQPFKNEGRVTNMSNDVLWRAFLFSSFPRMDLALYLKPKDHDFPLIVIFNEGKIIAVDYEKFNAVKDLKYNSLLKQGDISEFYSDGLNRSQKWKQWFDMSLAERKVDKSTYDNLCQFFSKTVELGKPLQPQLEEALRIYKTDINSIREEINLNPRTTFNDGQYLFLMNKKRMVSFYMLELYQPEEFPGIICDLTFSLWNACVAPDKNNLPTLNEREKLDNAIINLQEK